MFGLVRAERVLDDLMGKCDQATATVTVKDGLPVTYARPSGTMRAVVRELRLSMSPLEILQVIAVIVDLIQTVGPYVRKIVDEILNRKRQNTL